MPTVPSAGRDLVSLAQRATAAVEALQADATAKVRERVTIEGRIVSAMFDREQHAAHGLAWLATYVEAVRQLTAYAERMLAAGRLTEIEELLVRIGIGEYLAQIFGGIPISQGEIVRLSDMGVSASAVAARATPEIDTLIATGNTAARRARLVELMRRDRNATVGSSGLDDTFESIREEMRKFADSEVAQHAQSWHRTNSYIPLDIIRQMSDLGVFGLTVPEDYGGMGLGKESMCVVSEELSRGYIGVGSLGTRSEIAAELILGGGTEEQKRKWLPKIASGEVLPTAVFTEPNTGSDLASLKTRAVRDGGVYKVYGNKTWITHPVRADLMTLLVRTNPKEPGYRGLSMLLAEKPRGDDKNPFPVKGMTGTEIEVLGYRGMKEYEIAFDGFEVKAENLLGGVEGLGFKQLMQTFESARIQTAARAIGVAQAAMEQALNYAQNRVQFGEPIAGFPRVADKIAMMAAEIMIARQLTYYAARQKDSGRRCDLEAGMAKLLAARVAWAAADNAVQIHGGNGFAMEFPISRILCDARILSIFEGAAEIQAQVIARRLLDGSELGVMGVFRRRKVGAISPRLLPIRIHRVRACAPQFGLAPCRSVCARSSQTPTNAAPELGPTGMPKSHSDSAALSAPARRAAMCCTIRIAAAWLIFLSHPVERDDWQVESWTQQGTTGELANDFPGWHPDVQAIIDNIETPFKWALMVRGPMPQWSDRRISLLGGDACHPTLPFMGQGGVMAIEDAYVIAACVKKYFTDPAMAFARYEDIRRERTSQVVRKSRTRTGRGLSIRQRSPIPDADLDAFAEEWKQKLGRERIDWVYTYDATAVAI